jgi:hypothetical protein
VSRGRALPALVAFVAALGFTGPVLRELVHETREDAKFHLTEVGLLPAPVSDQFVAAARRTLRPGETWKLVTAAGPCEADPLRFFWLAFRLIPNVADCGSAEVTLYWEARPPPGNRPATAGPSFAIVRR